MTYPDGAGTSHIGARKMGTVVFRAGRCTVVRVADKSELRVFDFNGQTNLADIGETVVLIFSRFEIERPSGVNLHGAGWVLEGVLKKSA